MDIVSIERQNPCMSYELCSQCAELFAAASHADEEFKAKLVGFFSSMHKDDQEMHVIEALGARHRDLHESSKDTERFARPAPK